MGKMSELAAQKEVIDEIDEIDEIDIQNLIGGGLPFYP